MEFKVKLRHLMTRHRLSQEAIARELEISQTKVSNWSLGKNVPDLYEASKIARVFGVDLNYLADDSLDEPPRATVSDDERAILLMCRRIGLELAIDRLAIVERTINAGEPHEPESGRLERRDGKTGRQA